MTRHVDESEPHVAVFQKREAQIDGDPAPLLFFQAVRMRARERFDQSGFPMIDVSGGADNDAFRVYGHSMVFKSLMLRKTRTRGQTSHFGTSFTMKSELLCTLEVFRLILFIRRLFRGSAPGRSYA